MPKTVFRNSIIAFLAFSLLCACPWDKETTVRITFAGLVAFASQGDGSVSHVLLPDAREGVTVTTCPPPLPPCDPSEIKIPRHAAMVVFDGRSEPWVLVDDDVEITAVTKQQQDRGGSGVLEHLGQLGSILPEIGPINPVLTSPSPAQTFPDALIARLTLSGGKWHVPGSALKKGPSKFRAIQGAASKPASGDKTAQFVEYVIEADSVTFKRKRSPNGAMAVERTLKGGEFEVYVGHLPIEEDAHARKVETGFFADTHFYIFYSLATSPPDATKRLIPMFPGEDHPPNIGTASGPRCMMALY